MFDLDWRYSCYQSFFRTQQLVFPNLSLLFWVLGFWPISPLLHTQFPESKRKKVNHLGKRSCRIFQISEQLWPFQTKNSKEQNKAGNFWQKKDSSPLTARPFDDVNPDARILTPLPLIPDTPDLQCPYLWLLMNLDDSVFEADVAFESPIIPRWHLTSQ